MRSKEAASKTWANRGHRWTTMTLMNLVLWITQAVLAFAFLMAGGMKVFAYEKYRAATDRKKPSGLSHGLVTFIGIAELAGAIGVIVPMAANVAPWLSAWAAAGLALIMLLATGYHLRRRESPATVVVLFAL